MIGSTSGVARSRVRGRPPNSLPVVCRLTGPGRTRPLRTIYFPLRLPHTISFRLAHLLSNPLRHTAVISIWCHGGRIGISNTLFTLTPEHHPLGIPRRDSLAALAVAIGILLIPRYRWVYQRRQWASRVPRIRDKALAQSARGTLPSYAR
jgi:hypothetical protein